MNITRADSVNQLPEPLQGNHFWTTDGNRFLRPKWNLPWYDNETAWCKEISQKSRQNAHDYVPELSQREVATIPEKYLVAAIKTAFTTMQGNWKLSKESQATKDQAAKINRRRVRKGTVRVFHVILQTVTHFCCRRQKNVLQSAQKTLFCVMRSMIGFSKQCTSPPRIPLTKEHRLTATQDGPGLKNARTPERGLRDHPHIVQRR